MTMFACMLFSAVAFAKAASVTETSTVSVNGPSPGFDKFWVSGDNIQHARGWIIPSTIFGGAVGEEGQELGTQIIYLDWNLDLDTGNGTFNGTFERTWTVNGVTDTYTGRFRATVMGFFFQGTTTGHGAAGTQYKASFAGVWGGPGSTSTGRILDPSGGS